MNTRVIALSLLAASSLSISGGNDTSRERMGDGSYRPHAHRYLSHWNTDNQDYDSDSNVAKAQPEENLSSLHR